MRWALIHGNRVETFASWEALVRTAVDRECAGQVIRTAEGSQIDLGQWDGILTVRFLPGFRALPAQTIGRRAA